MAFALAPSAPRLAARRRCCRHKSTAIAHEVSGGSRVAQRARALAPSPPYGPPTAIGPPPRSSAPSSPRTACKIELISLPADGTVFRHAALAAGLERALRRALGAAGKGAGWMRAHRLLGRNSLGLADSVSGRAEAEVVDVGEEQGDGLRRAGRPRQARPRLVPAGIGGSAGDLVLEPPGSSPGPKNGDRLVGARRRPRALGPPPHPFPEHPTFAFLGLAAPGACRARRAAPQGSRAPACGNRRRPGRVPLIPTAVIPGRTQDEEVVYSCHLDHPRRERTTTPAAAPSSRSPGRCSV